MKWWEWVLIGLGVVGLLWLLIGWYLRWAYKGLNDRTD